MNAKKLFALLLAVVMVVAVFAGCNNEPAPVTTAPTAAPTTEPTEAPLVIETFPEGDYVWKTSVVTMASNWNPHTYQSTDDAMPLDYTTVGLYSFIFNDELHPVEGKAPYEGYVIVPEMAADMPVDVTKEMKASNPEFGIPETAETGYAYKVALNPLACWDDGTPINAETYVESFKRLLDPKMLNYRAADWYGQDFSIAGAENYANQGRTQYNKEVGLQFADLVLGADGTYATKEGNPVYIVVGSALAEWLGGNSLQAYVNAYKDASFSMTYWEQLVAAMNADGYVALTDETKTWILDVITGNPEWGETEAELHNYLAYGVPYPETFDWSGVGVLATGEYANEADKEIGDNEYDVVYGWAAAEKVSGEATSVKKAEFVKIDGTKYLLAAGQAGLTAGNEYDLYVDANGFVIFAEETDGAAVIDDVYVVGASYTESDKWDNDSYFVQLIDMNGEVTEIELEYAQDDLAGKLVTIEDKKVGDYKANNDKYIMTEWDEADYGEDWDLYDFDEALTFEDDDNRVVIGGKTFRVNSKTNYVMIGDEKDDIVVTVKVGGINVTNLDAAGYVICEDGETTVDTIIMIAAEEIEEDSKFADDLIFVKSVSKEYGDEYILQTVYYADGSKDTMKIADDQDLSASTFYEYKVNEDGYYEVTEADEIASGSYIWEDEEGVINSAEITDPDALYEGLLTVGTIEDIDVSAAEYVDTHSKTTDGQYEKTVASLEKAFDLLDKGTISSFKIALNVSEDGAVVIYLTHAYEA